MKKIILLSTLMTQLLTANVFADNELKTSDVFVTATRTPISKKNVIADTTIITEEEIIPVSSNRVLFLLGPALAMIVALVTSSVVPWGAPVATASGTIALQVADVDMGILIVFSVVSVGVYGIMIGGWASNNKFSLLAAIRGASQMVSYELPMSLALVAILFMTGSLKMSEIVLYQINNGWNVVYQPLGFLLFFICA